MNTQVIQRSLFPQFPVPSQADVIAKLEPHYRLLWHTIKGPWEEFVEYRTFDKNFADWTEDQIAQWMTIQSTNRARHLLDGKDGVKLVVHYGKLIIQVDEQFAVTIKKLTKYCKRPGDAPRMRRSNYLTPRNKDYWEQRKGEDLPNFPRVILGYELLQEATDLRVLIAYPRTRHLGVEWAIEIPAQEALAGFHSPRLAAPPIENEQEKGYVITSPAANEEAGSNKGTGS